MSNSDGFSTKCTKYRRLFGPRTLLVPGKMRNRLEPSATTHHNSFNPNCTCRELVAVDVITPAVGEGSPAAAAYTTGFGVLKFAWLSKLKISARNCNPRRSVSKNRRDTEKSVS